MTTHVSVLINNYNYGRFLGAAIDSILAQDIKNTGIEIIVVDDGSTDNSKQIIESYGQRVRGIFQKNQGQTSAVNRGFTESNGKYIYLLDADDVWLPSKLSQTLPLFKDAKIGAVQHFLQDADEKLNPLPRRFPKWPARYRLDDLIAGRMELTAVSGLGFRREALQKALPLPKELFFYLDDWMLARTSFFFDIANVPIPLAYHRIHGANWYANNYHEARKIEGDMIHRAIYRKALDGWLAERGLSLSQEALNTERLEIFRRQVLLQSLKGNSRQALTLWRQGVQDLPKSAHSWFRLLTVLIAVISSDLYLALYDLYSQGAIERVQEKTSSSS